MKKSAFTLSFLLFFICSPLFASTDKFLVLNHVTLIDATGTPEESNIVVVIKNDRIANIGQDGTITIPDGAQVIDANGKFLIPGLWDMHVHWEDKEYLPLFIANGVTSVRIMWGQPIHRKLQKSIAKKKLIGPRMLIGSEVIDGMPPVFEEATSSAVSDENQARRMVDAVAANRPNFIKVYNRLTQPEYQAIIDEARRKGLPVEGHVPYAVSIVEASESGQKSIEHLYGILLASSSDEEQLRKQMVNAKEADWMAEIAQAKKLVQTYDEKKANAVFSLLAKNKTWQCPTLTVLRTAAYLNDPAFRNDIRVKYMPSWIEEYWDPQYNNRFTSRTDEDDANFKALFEKQMEIVRKMNQFGVRMIAGTDTGNPYCFPGFSLHDELALLVQAGLSPMQALQMATRNAAEFSGELDSLGTIETGKIADLVLLESDPLKNIDNTRSISAVIYGGEFFDHRQLLAMLNNAESQGAKPSIAEVLHDTIQTKGIAAAFQQYHQLKTSASHQYDFAESGLKALASQLLQNDSFNSGIAILKLIAENYPDSVDAFDHLAAGYQAGGNKKMAIFYYNMALKKNPNDLKAKEQLAQLRR